MICQGRSGRHDLRDFGLAGCRGEADTWGMMSVCNVRGVRGLVLVVVSCVLPTARAQEADPTAGSVTGQVVCGDTQRPARFAGVLLLLVPSTTAAAKPVESGERAQVLTGLDGSYTATHLAPGDYYAFASMAGYVQPASMVQALMEAGADMTKPIPGIPLVHVSAGGTVRQNLTLLRGGVVSGHVLWDDGSPIPRALVTVQLANGDGRKLPSQFGSLDWASAMMGGGMFSMTDDLGQYRIAGLAAGKYVAVAVVAGHGQFATRGGRTSMSSSDVGLVAYAPGSFRKDGAKPIAVSAGQEQSGEDITLSLTGTHSVSGRVISAEDGHGISFGVVRVEDARDNALNRLAHVDTSGGFNVEAVPPGTYQLTVSGAVDAGRSYADGNQSVVVGDTDVVGLSVTLQPSKNAQGNGSQ